MRRLLTLYKRILNKRPILTQAVQTGVIVSSGDVICQTLIEKRNRQEYNLVRTGQFVVLGFCFLGPSLTLWYRLLAQRIGMKGGRVTLVKVAADQLLFAPICIVALLATLAALQGLSLEEISNRVKRDYKDVLIANYKLWPAVQLLNFYVVPLNYQVLLVQFVALSWNTYISWKTQPKKKSVD